MDGGVYRSVALGGVHHVLEAVADATLLVDQHAHPFWVGEGEVQTLATVLTEGGGEGSCRGTLAFRRALKDMRDLHTVGTGTAAVSGVGVVVGGEEEDSTTTTGTSGESVTGCAWSPGGTCEVEREVEAARADMGMWPLAKRCFAAAGVAAVLLDDGLSVPEGRQAVRLADFPVLLDVPVARRVLRLETEAEKVVRELVARNEEWAWTRDGGVDKRARTTLRARQFREALGGRLRPLAEGVVAFKSIAAYRSGLAVRLDWTDEELEEGLRRTGAGRVQEAVVVDCVVRAGMEAAREYGIPVQFHCGFGDTDLRLERANPVLLRQVIDGFPEVRVVLLHAAWPYMREAAYLAAVHEGVYVDVGLAIPLLSVRGMFRAVDAILEIAPVDKVLYSSDAHSVPDAFFLAARWGRRVIAGVVAAAVESGDLTLAEGKVAVRRILAENSVRLYKLPVSV